MEFHILILVSVLVFTRGQQLVIDEHTPQNLFDEDLYERVLDSEECERQVEFLRNNDSMLFGRFLDAGVRLPRGMFLAGNTDLGHYHQCLNIQEQRFDMNIAGKYCFLNIPLNQSLDLPFGFNDVMLPSRDFSNKKIVRFNNGIITNAQPFAIPRRIEDLIDPQEIIATADLNLALCMPKVCTTNEWQTHSFFNLSAIGFRSREQFCRLPNDKPWVPVDYVAIGIFSFIALLTALGTLYDVNHMLIQRKDPKKSIIYLRMFSVYTNSRRLMTFAPNPNALDCLDGIRVISMMWVIVGHSFTMHNFNMNFVDGLHWLISGDAVWVVTGLFAVDSFFLMAGLLLVYTSRGKMSGISLLKRLHVFYLNRLLRLFPLLATLVLLEASVFHRMVDGPYWVNVARNAQRCRLFWWSTLLHIQNYLNPDDICIQHSWYVAIDVQLHIVSPIILFWVLGKSKKAAWSALVSGLLAILVAATIWNFMKDLPSTNMSIIRIGEQARYMNLYYVNTLTRGAPFFVGMIYGYLLNICKGKKIKLNMVFVLTIWVLALCMIASCFYTSYVIMQLDWDNQTGDNLFNSFMRAVWATGLGWVIFACSKGYGGPINWLLTLSIWKVPARLSYAMYLYHFPVMFVVAGMQVMPDFFSQGGRIFDFMAFLVLSLWMSYVVTVVIDAPCSTIIKMIMERGQGRRRPPVKKVADLPKPESSHEKDTSLLENNMLTTLQKDNHLEKNDPTSQKNGLLLEANDLSLQRNEPILENGSVNLEKNARDLEESLEGNSEVSDRNEKLGRIGTTDEPQTAKEVSKF